MDIKIYRVVAQYPVDEVDGDMCSYQTWETFFNDMFPTRVSAIRKAQKIHSKCNCYVEVTRLSVTEQGLKDRKLIYKLYYGNN